MNYREKQTSILQKGPKSRLHKANQEYFLKKIPEARSEVWFKEINQRADIYDSKRKIVFEIQISKISMDEIIRRSKGYETLGLQIIWIFPLVGYSLSQVPFKTFLSTINEQGIGEILDVVNEQRYLVDVRVSYPLMEEEKGIYFKGDIVDRQIQGLKVKRTLSIYKRVIHKWFQKFV